MLGGLEQRCASAATEVEAAGMIDAAAPTRPTKRAATIGSES